MIQGKGQPVPGRFQEGLFSGPAIEETVPSILFWKRTEHVVLIHREISFRQIQQIIERPHELEIDPDLPAERNGINGAPMRMGHVETDRTVLEILSQCGLPEWTIPERDAMRLNPRDVPRILRKKTRAVTKRFRSRSK